MTARAVAEGESILPISDESDIARARRAARQLACESGFPAIDLTRIATAVSELARNTFNHGRGGRMLLTQVRDAERIGIRCVFVDEGPGIEDVTRAMEEGFTTRNGMGLGLSGSRRLMDRFEVQSAAGAGTRVEIIKWKTTGSR